MTVSHLRALTADHFSIEVYCAIAIGNNAAGAADRSAGRVAVIRVMQPSHNGGRDFNRQIRSLYDLKAESEHMAQW